MDGWMTGYKTSMNKEMSLETGILETKPFNITLRLPLPAVPGFLS